MRKVKVNLMLILAASVLAGAYAQRLYAQADPYNLDVPRDRVTSVSVDDGYGEYVLVPAAEFHMGDNFGEGEPNELPVHIVYLDSFYIGRYEVTNAEYKKFIDDGGYTTESYWMAGGFGEYGSQPSYWTDAQYRGGGIAGNGNFPVAGVNWYEAIAYCTWLSAKTGKTYRLPTEAEWEKAARGDDSTNTLLGHQRRYPWGDAIDSSYANYGSSGDPYSEGLTPVGYYNGSVQGTFPTHDNASPYGAYDMAGNVAEMCSDWYSDNYYASSPESNPEGPSTATSGGRVLRGGGLYALTSSLRSADRYNNYPNDRYSHYGFRCLRDVGGSTANNLPSASFTVLPSSGTTDTTFAFDASSSTGTGLTYRWDFNGDGAWDFPLSGYTAVNTATYRFSSAGTFTVILEVKDEGGLTDITSGTVTVIEEITPPVVTNVTVTPNPTEGATEIQVNATVSAGSAPKPGRFEYSNTSMMVIPVKSDKTGSIGKNAAVQVINVGNSYVKAYVDDSGFEDTGEFYILTADDRRLLYGSYTGLANIKIDDQVFGFGGTAGSWLTPLSVSDNQVTGVWKIGGIKVTFTLTIVRSTTSGNYDTFRANYYIANEDTTGHAVGFFKMFDTMVNNNDYAPVSAGDGYNLNEREFTGADVPNFWQAFEVSPTQGDSLLMAQGTLYGGGAVKPDRFVIGDWTRLNDILWDYTPSGYYGDSGVGMWWNPVTLSPGAGRSVATLYGLGRSTASEDVFALTLSAERELSVISNLLSPNPFQVTALVTNDTTITVSGVEVSISLPSGLSLESGETQTKTLGSINAGVSAQTTWKVRVEERSAAQTYSYSVTATSATQGIPDATVDQYIYVPGVSQGLYVAAAECFIGTDPGQGGGTPMSAVDTVFDEQTEEVEAAINIASLSSGTHTVYVRGRDSNGNWSETASRVVTIQGPRLPEIEVSPSSIDFGNVVLNTSHSRSFAIFNRGDASLTVSSIDLTAGTMFWVSPDSAIVAPGDSQAVTVFFAPLLAETYSGTVIITSNDDDEAQVQVSLSGIGIRGDLSGDGRIDVLDVAMVFQYVIHQYYPEGFPEVRLTHDFGDPESADINGDNEIDLKDVQTLVNIIQGLESQSASKVDIAALKRELLKLGMDPSLADILDFIVLDADGAMPNSYKLYQNYPNPFNPATFIRFSLPAGFSGRVRLTIYDINGRVVRELLNDILSAGMHRIVWNGAKGTGEVVSSGIYLCRMQAGRFSETRKMTFLK